MGELICRGCGNPITQVNVVEKTTFDIRDAKICDAGGDMMVAHTCGHQLEEEQVYTLGLLE